MEKKLNIQNTSKDFFSYQQSICGESNKKKITKILLIFQKKKQIICLVKIVSQLHGYLI